MVTKPARMYTKITGPAYTRREFMGGVPYPKITTFTHGNQMPILPASSLPFESSIVQGVGSFMDAL